MKFYIVDDDGDMRALFKMILEKAGHKIIEFSSGRDALAVLQIDPPDCIITDIIMPGMDGMELIKTVRENDKYNSIKIIVVSVKSYEFDKKRALSMGADGYIEKPVNKEMFMKDIDNLLCEKIELTFWGVHGTLPVPGRSTLRYGGNTSCAAIRFPKNRFFILDAGTGIKELSNHLMKTGSRNMKATFFITHSHWDHINAFPFFSPLYIPGNEFQVCGPAQGDLTMREVISSQMDSVYFPITIKEMCARVYFKDLVEGAYNIDNIEVKTKLLIHPGYALGYRFQYGGKSICYITDNELYMKEVVHYSNNVWENMIKFVQDADILIHDATYTLEEYAKKFHWGHSCVNQVVKLAMNANVKTLYLYHHDIDNTDEDIDQKVETANEIINENKSSLLCASAVEQQTISLKI